ncbi:EF-hand domain-containing protein [Pseudonocardia sp. CA-142604]|uniref:EF-hand domain-containing protein n=1 Tax=Pseudonocardia sp. CA-142604 TaxID=3240024 RepID=UPI003D8A4A81
MALAGVDDQGVQAPSTLGFQEGSIVTTATPDIVSLKLGRVFDSYNSDNDETLDWADFERLIDRFCATYKIDSVDWRARSLRAMCQMYWSELLRHADVPEEELTKDQFVNASRRLSQDTSRFNMIDGVPHALFDCIDTDADGSISDGEFTRMLSDIWEVQGPEAMGAFAQVDTDGDGTIERDEFLRAFREYVVSDDAGAARSLLFGRI